NKVKSVSTVALIPYGEVKTSRVARSSRIDAGKDELTQEREEHEEHEEERSGILEHKQDTRTVSLTGRSNRPNRIPKGEIGKIHKNGSWVVVSPTANRAVPIESPEDERLAGSLATSGCLESTKGSSPHAEEPSPRRGRKETT